MARSTASRKYLITINNPMELGFTHDTIKNILNAHSGIEYWCLCDEVGAEGTPHTHVYAVFCNAVMFTTLQKRFYGAHLDTARGSNQECRDYIRKEGKWLEDEKHETNLTNTFEESGELPPDRDTAKKETAEILDRIKNGASDFELLNEFPSLMNRLDKVERARQTFQFERFKNEFRKLDTFYVWGKTGVGKTRSIMEKYGYENVYRVTNYDHPFDGYQGQDVIIFEEFRSSLKIGLMLTLLEGYPIRLPCRYMDKQACYTKVYIITNISIEQQYPDVQTTSPTTWNAFKRRINHIEYRDSPGSNILAWTVDPAYEDEKLC